MMPDSGVALLIALCALPGYIYLQRTADYRRSDGRSAVGEVLQILLVSVVTTGAAAFFFLHAFSDWAEQLLGGLSKEQGGLDSEDLRLLASQDC